MITLQPGVSSNQARQPGFDSNTSVPFSFNGRRQSSNNWLLDGWRNLDTYNGNNLTVVNLDAIAEVRIERNSYSAEYGRNSGAQVNVITRSGTNSFHGSAFEFFRNDLLDARNFFAKAKPKNRYNNFGWTLGCPGEEGQGVLLPLQRIPAHLAEHRNTHRHRADSAQIGGDFAGGRVIKDPDTQQPFAGKIIPAGRLDQNAV